MIIYRKWRSDLLELFEVVGVELRTKAGRLAQQFGDMPLVFGRVVPVGGLEVACQLCAIVERPELLEDDPFAFPDFEGGAKGTGDIGIERLVDFVILLFHQRPEVRAKITVFPEQHQQEQSIVGLQCFGQFPYKFRLHL